MSNISYIEIFNLNPDGEHCNILYKFFKIFCLYIKIFKHLDAISIWLWSKNLQVKQTAEVASSQNGPWIFTCEQVYPEDNTQLT